MGPFSIKSAAFKDGSAIPEQFTEHGENISPPLKWNNLPKNTQDLVLICEDPDAPNPPFVHWVVYNLYPVSSDLKPGIPDGDLIRGPSFRLTQGKNSAGKIGYAGPNPPQDTGTHRYYFRLYALDKRMDLPAGLTVEEVLAGVKDHVIAETWLMGKHSYH